MVFKIIIKPLAVSDIDKAIGWYEKRSIGLGKRFYLSVEESIYKIAASPSAYFSITKEVRRILLQNFPYKLFYTFSADTIYIIGVLHVKRSKAFVRRRIS